MASADLLGIVEAAYRIDAAHDDWLEGVARACQPALDEGFGVCAFEFKHAMGSPPQIVRRCKIGVPEDLSQIYGAVFSGMAPDVKVRPFTHGPCTTGSQMMGQRGEFIDNEHMKRHVHKFGMYDSIWITAAEPSGSGCGIHAGRAQLGWLSRRAREQWARIASHIAAAARIRRRLEGLTESPQVEAVLSPEGALLHAEGPAMEPEAIARLRGAVIDLEKARSPGQRADISRSLDGWQGLIDARWSLLDQFESDGKRFVVARENAPRPPGPAALTERERQIVGYAALGHDNKIIAYDLGIAHATVKVLMARAAAKLGVRARSDVITAYLAACGKRAPALGTS
jgi:DNA-binding CsgD family transcriptional regulator